MKVVFSASNNLAGYGIRVATLSDWCHVDILFDDGTLIGALGYGVEKTTLEHRLSYKSIVRYRVDEILLPDEEAARAFAEAQVGKPYDFTAVVAFLMPWRANWHNESKWFCSELVAATAKAGGRPIARLDQWRVTPAFLDYNPLLNTIKPTCNPRA